MTFRTNYINSSELLLIWTKILTKSRLQDVETWCLDTHTQKTNPNAHLKRRVGLGIGLGVRPLLLTRIWSDGEKHCCSHQATNRHKRERVQYHNSLTFTEEQIRALIYQNTAATPKNSHLSRLMSRNITSITHQSSCVGLSAVISGSEMKRKYFILKWTLRHAYQVLK